MKAKQFPYNVERTVISLANPVNEHQITISTQIRATQDSRGSSLFLRIVFDDESLRDMFLKKVGKVKIDDFDLPSKKSIEIEIPSRKYLSNLISATLNFLKTMFYYSVPEYRNDFDYRNSDDEEMTLSFFSIGSDGLYLRLYSDEETADNICKELDGFSKIRSEMYTFFFPSSVGNSEENFEKTSGDVQMVLHDLGFYNPMADDY